MSCNWHIHGAKVTGQSHKKSGTVCQDNFWYDSYKGAYILTAADGHGGKRYVRSDKGSAYACQAAQSCVSEYLEKIFLTCDDNIIKEIAKSRFITDLLKTWRELVDKDVAENPLTEEEKEILQTNQIYKAYGSTLLIAVILPDKILAWQIGDGDILYYNKDGGVKRIMADDSLLGNETASLCQKNAEQEFRFHVQNTCVEETMPDLIMLSTDGYKNSFKSDEGFLAAPMDYYELIQKEGIEAVGENLEAWLDETSSCGSGDDITLLIGARIINKQ